MGNAGLPAREVAPDLSGYDPATPVKLPFPSPWLWIVIGMTLVACAAFESPTPDWDEVGYLGASQLVWHGPGPMSTRLQTYETAQTPGALLALGWMVSSQGDGLRRLRIATALITTATLWAAYTVGESLPSLGGLPGGVGMLAAMVVIPHFLYCGTHFYSDMPCILLGALGLLSWRRGHIAASGGYLAAAYVFRQFAVYAVAGLALVELIRSRGTSWKAAASLVWPTAIVVGVLALLWGGVQPPSATGALWRAAIHAPALSQANYYVVCIGAFASWILVVGRRSIDRRLLVLSALLVPILLIAVPMHDALAPYCGPIDRVVSTLVGDGAGRTAALAVFWWLGASTIAHIARDARQGPWPLAATVLLVTFLIAHSVLGFTWEKYYLLAQLPFAAGLWWSLGEREHLSMDGKAALESGLANMDRPRRAARLT